MKICILDAKTLGKDIDLTPLETCGEITIYDLTSPDQVVSRIKDMDVVITNKVLLNESNLKDAKNVKLIALTATGYNNIDIDYAKQKGIAVCNVAGYSTKSVAQHTFAMLFYLLEQLRKYDEYVQDKSYVKSDTFSYIAWPFREIAGSTFGIIGMGAIGKEVAKIATAFGANVIYYSTSGKNNHTDYERVDLDTIVKQSDILSIHAPLNNNTNNLIDYKELKKMKKSAILLNLGRGSIVNEEGLMKALNEELIYAAGLDVLEKEPMTKENPLFNVKNKDRLFITPHIAWASIEARKQLIQEIVMNILAFQKQESRNRIV